MNNIKIRFNEDNIKVNVDKPKEIQVNIEKPNEIQFGLKERLNIIAPKYHNELLGLDYEHSGHTGFASSKDLENYVPKKLNLLNPLNSSSDRNKVLLYVDNNGQDCNITMNDLLDKKIRTVVEIPNDYQVGDYLFLERKEN